jgi:hypothetical protein
MKRDAKNEKSHSLAPLFLLLLMLSPLLSHEVEQKEGTKAFVGARQLFVCDKRRCDFLLRVCLSASRVSFV